ncbi:sugar phosphate isomerase/epimerase [Paenibacillus cellulosilyticus]|uniref:Sugar phosphate isomerase/epimerase n=1 Tax=Paenibacillus cellulosilyticus TaxID=375489 RepID=A0A2V2Z0X2_9BACL|nr:sugar phosphate isomerase/epimerase family protein [Paenibacillus cellulosilyticus]PWW08507.1 sugar phosphate isomerase/epimerase [Paenibacillus cellulosilyticus]QKS48087.1 sugar phosphate isomerase/epimerase [Paenibacillus cellulosilyticus]
MGFGTLAHTFGCKPLVELAEEAGRSGIDFVQLALAKAIADIDTSTGNLSPGLANHIGEQFDRNGVRIGVLGCYINPIEPDLALRRADIARFKEHIRFARDFGTSIVATETGRPDIWKQQAGDRYSEVAWSVLRDTVSELAEEADRWGVTIGLEPVCVHTLASPAHLHRLLEEVPSSTLGVVLDPCNLIYGSLELFEQRAAIIDSAFELLGDHIVLAHVKDLDISPDGKISETVIGHGSYDIASFIQRMNARKPLIDMSIEALKPETVAEALAYARAAASGTVTV